MKPQTSPATAQEIRRLLGNKSHPALIAAQAAGHFAQMQAGIPAPHQPCSGQPITAQQAQDRERHQFQ